MKFGSAETSADVLHFIFDSSLTFFNVTGTEKARGQ